jgi:hypothetical protein
MLPLAVASFLIIAENLLSTSQVVGGGRVNQLVAP